MALLCFLSMQHCTSGASGAVTRSAIVDIPNRVLLNHDVRQPRQPAWMSHHPVDHASPTAICVHATRWHVQNRDFRWNCFASTHVRLLALTYATFLPLLPSKPFIVSVVRGVATQHICFAQKSAILCNFCIPVH